MVAINLPSLKQQKLPWLLSFVEANVLELTYAPGARPKEKDTLTPKTRQLRGTKQWRPLFRNFSKWRTPVWVVYRETKGRFPFRCSPIWGCVLLRLGNYSFHLGLEGSEQPQFQVFKCRLPHAHPFFHPKLRQHENHPFSISQNPSNNLRNTPFHPTKPAKRIENPLSPANTLALKLPLKREFTP